MNRDLRALPDHDASRLCSIGAAIAGVAAIGGSVINASAASSAANTQAQAAEAGQQLVHQQYLQTRADLLPYNQFGQMAAGQIAGMPNFNFAPTQAQLEQTPGYQFALTQGLKSAQNSAAARGLGTSGAAFKGAEGFATGLASNTYQNQFANALAQYNTNLGRLQGQASLGEGAAAMTGNYGTQTAASQAALGVGAANASAAGTVGVANAISNPLSMIGGLGAYSALQNGGLYNNQFYNTNLPQTNYGGASGTSGYGGEVPI